MEMIGLQIEYGILPCSIWGYKVELIDKVWLKVEMKFMIGLGIIV